MDQKEKKEQKVVHGHDMAAALQSVLGSEVSSDQIKTFKLVFVERDNNGGKQKFAVIDSAGGIEVFPMLTRFDPRLGKKYLCYVVFKKDENRRGGKLGFALPVSLLKLKEDEWKPPSANVLRGICFRKSNGGDGGARYIGRANGTNNGKVVAVFGGYGPPTTRPVDVLVAERMSCFAVAGEVVVEKSEGIGSMGALVLAAETAETVLGSVDPFMVLHCETYYDAADILEVSKAASARDVKKVAQKKLRENHPDAKIGKYREQFKCDPDEKTVAEWNDDNQLIAACRDKMLIYVHRRDAEAQYHPYGVSFKKPMKASQLVKKLDHCDTMEALIAAAKECGFEVNNSESTIGPGLCKVLSGYFTVKAEEAAKQTASVTDGNKSAEPTMATSV